MAEHKPPPDQSQRELALNVQTSFVVRAPAGSGKTTLLVSRYLRLLSMVQQPEEILAITFTRKAAAEMRARVVQQLRSGDDEFSIAAQLADTNHQWNLLENPNRLKIQTIDSFNSTLANSFPIQSRQSPDIQVSESSQELYSLAVQRFFNHLYVQSNKLSVAKTQTEIIADLLALLGNDFSYANRLIAKMLSKRDQWLQHTAHILRKVLAEETIENEVVSRLFQFGISQLNKRTTQLFLGALSASRQKELGELIQFSRHSLNEAFDSNSNPGLPGGLPNTPAQWRDLGELLTTKKGLIRKTVSKAQGFPAANGPNGDQNRILKARMIGFLQTCSAEMPGLKNMRVLPDTTLPMEEARNLFTLCAGLSLCALDLQAVFAEEGMMDYTQMSIAAMQALGDSDNVTDIALTLDYRINHLLIDEYQDTSWFQNKLILRLTREWQQDQGRTFFAVGDPMQSIYRFRDAEVALFLRSTEMQFGDVSPQAVTLTANFRSSPKLVHWFNTVFEKSFGDSSDSNLGRVPYQSSVSARPDLAIIQGTGVTLDIFTGKHAKINEAKSIARQISTVQLAHPKAHIAVLVRSRTHIDNLVRELDANSIPWQGTDIDSLKKEPTVMDMLSIVRMLWQSESLIPCLAFLRSPLMGLQLADLLKISQHLHRQAVLGINAIVALLDVLPKIHTLDLSSQANTALARAETCLGDAYMKVGRVFPRQIAEQLWIRLGGFEVYNSERERKANIKLLNLIENQAQTGSLYALSIPDLELKVEALYLENTPQEGAVQLMTIHKSKGLQFDHVFLPALTSTTRPRDKELLRWRPDGDALLMASSLNVTPGSLYAWLDCEDADREANETRRLLYVASTRACLSLHLSGCLEPDKSPANSSLLATIWDSVQDDANWYDTENAIQSDDKPNKPKAVEYQRLPKPYRWFMPEATSTDLFMGSRAGNFNKEINAENSSVQDSPEIAFGLLVHEILYELSLNLPTDNQQFVNDSASVWRTRLKRRTRHLAMPDTDLDQLTTRIQKQVRGFLEDPDGQWVLSPDHLESHSEAPFTGFYKELLVNVVIDRTFLDETGTRWIIDYKSSSKPESLTTEVFINQQLAWHRPQMEKYLTLLSAWKPGPYKAAIYFTALSQLQVIKVKP